MKRITIIACCLVCLSSCARQIVESMPTNQTSLSYKTMSLPHFSTTKSSMNESGDTLRRLSFSQRDPDMRMINQILYINGEYCLAITSTEAEILGIPEEVYVKYEQHVARLNTKE